MVWIKRGYGSLYYTLSVNYVNTDPITSKMLLWQEAYGRWVVQCKRYTSVTNVGFNRCCNSPMQRLPNTPSFVATVPNILQRKWCAKHFVTIRYALVPVKVKLT